MLILMCQLPSLLNGDSEQMFSKGSPDGPFWIPCLGDRLTSLAAFYHSFHVKNKWIEF